MTAIPVFADPLPRPLIESDFRTYEAAQVKLGQLLFYDRVLSGTYRVSCATCHNHDRAGSNGVRLDGKAEPEPDSLAVNGLPVYEPLKPSSKHAPTLFNLGAKQFSKLFADGRVAEAPEGGFLSPAADQLPTGLRDVLAVQALFPAVTGDELVGTVENDLKTASHMGNAAVWNELARRVQDLEDYWPHFQRAYPKLKSPAGISIAHIANSISAFVGMEWRSVSAPFDAFVGGDKSALNAQQIRGLELFYGKVGCSVCHSGALQTDHEFHFVPSGLWRFDQKAKDRTGDVHEGRKAVTGEPQDIFKWRTPSLRNVARTAPYGHAGSVLSLRNMVRLHLKSDQAVKRMQLEVAAAGTLSETETSTLKANIEIASEAMSLASFSDHELDSVIDDLVSFLESLTDEKSLAGKLGKPVDVPSSLALD